MKLKEEEEEEGEEGGVFICKTTIQRTTERASEQSDQDKINKIIKHRNTQSKKKKEAKSHTRATALFLFKTLSLWWWWSVVVYNTFSQ